MAGSRLEYWSTLPRNELETRVQAEMRMTNLSFAEQQLLDAALERLRTWREPGSMLRSKSGRIQMRDDDPNAEDISIVPEKQEPKPAPAKPKKEKKVVARKAKAKTKAGGRKKMKAAGNGSTKRAAGRAPRIADDAKIVKTGKDNPYRENSESYTRVESVLKLSGQTAGTIRKKLELKPTTLSNMVKHGLIRAD
jgi:hypothetical protein